MPSLTTMMSARLRRWIAPLLPLASLVIAAPLLPGCGGAAAPSDSAASPPPPVDVKSSDDLQAGLVRVGEVVPVATQAAEPAPPPDPILWVKPVKKEDPATSTLSDPTAAATATAAASAAPKPKEASGKPDSDSHGKGSVKGAVVDSAGGLSESEVRATIVKEQTVFRSCYDIGVAATSGAFAGVVALRTVIGPTGTVASVDVLSSSTKVARVDACVADAVRRIQFPAKGGSAVVGFPITFGR